MTFGPEAFAKVAGSYGALEGGIPEVAFQASRAVRVGERGFTAALGSPAEKNGDVL